MACKDFPKVFSELSGLGTELRSFWMQWRQNQHKLMLLYNCNIRAVFAKDECQVCLNTKHSTRLICPNTTRVQCHKYHTGDPMRHLYISKCLMLHPLNTFSWSLSAFTLHSRRLVFHVALPLVRLGNPTREQQ